VNPEKHSEVQPDKPWFLVTEVLTLQYQRSNPPELSMEAGKGWTTFGGRGSGMGTGLWPLRGSGIGFWVGAVPVEIES